jgi:hypothetical protein
VPLTSTTSPAVRHHVPFRKTTSGICDLGTLQLLPNHSGSLLPASQQMPLKASIQEFFLFVLPVKAMFISHPRSICKKLPVVKPVAVANNKTLKKLLQLQRSCYADEL